MQLPAGQHTLLAGFRSERQARGAADELVRLGASAVQVDRVSLWPRGDAARDTRPAPPLSGRTESLANLTLGIATADPDRGAALAAHPAASGLAGGPAVRLAPYLLTAVVDQRHLEQAVAAVRRWGGQL
ncbi:MAG TPA: hypothetical protein VIL11_00760 [Limnochordales bacterium]